MNKKYIIANWKMNPQTWAEAEMLLDGVNEYLETLGDRREFSLVFCPPFVFTEEVSKILATSHFEHQAFLGAQDIAIADSGALTGEVSGPMLAKLGVRYAIIGHSERRWKLGESDEVVNLKLKAALRNELLPIVCIGERSREGDWQTVLHEQIAKTFAGLTADDIGKCVVAYEPVWAISTNPGAHPDTPESAAQAVEFARSVLKLISGQDGNIMLYGGSVNPGNASGFLSQTGIDGVLVGGASVKKDEFIKILELASQF